MHSATDPTMGNTADGIVAHLERLIGQPQVSEAYVRFRIDLLAAQGVARQALAKTAPGQPGAAQMVRLPLGPGDVMFPAELLGRLFQAIRVAAVTHGHETEDIQRLVVATTSDPDMLPTLASATVGPDLTVLESVARRWQVSVDALLFVGRTLASPCVAHAVRMCGSNPVDRASELEAHRCPACKSSPSVARLRRADGRRILTCGLCGSEWEAVRLACACCGTQDRASLGVLRLDDADARWVETCERCKGYIKTVDERKLAEGEMVFPVVEEAATLHLDLLAEREGYIRRVPYVLAG